MNKLFFKTFLFLQPLLTIGQFKSDRVDSLLSNSTEQHSFNGTVLIAQYGNIIFNKSYGFADYKAKTQFSKKTTFQIASISKQFTAFGIMLLQAAGKLKYNDKVQQYLTDFPYDNVTIRQLLHHTAGLPEFWEGIRPKLDLSIANGNKELFLFLKQEKLPLEYVPGSKWAYSDIGYDLLAMIIENISGLSYEKFMKENVFRPAGMNETNALMVTDIQKIKNKSIAYGHTWLADSNRYEYTHLLPGKEFVFYLGNFYGDGSVITTAEDLLKWDKILYSEKLLSREDLQIAFQPAKNLSDSVIILNTANPFIPTYGFGWALAEHPTLGKMYYHNGGHPGFTSYYLRCPDKKLVVIFLCNLDSSPAVHAVKNKLMELIYAEVK